MPEQASFRNIPKIAIVFSSVAAVLAVCQSASAQLNVGNRGIQPGLEEEYLQYQIQNPNLNQMRVIPGCETGFGLSCNKTGSVLEKLLEQNGGPNYQNLLLRAAGGSENLQNFAGYYGNNPNIYKAPYASFWRNDSPKVMDGYQYVLGQNISRTPVEGLGGVTRNFTWAPYSGVGNALSQRDGLLNLKLAYGRELFTEAAKIPNIEQQIQQLNLSPEMKSFYLSRLSTGLDALNSGNNNQLQQSIFELLSYPYSEDGGLLGRPINGVPQELSQITTEGIPGDILVSDEPVVLGGEELGLDTPVASVGDILAPGSADAFPLWPLFGLPILALPFLLLGDNSSNNSSDNPSNPQSVPVANNDSPGTSGQPNPNDCLTNGNGSSNGGQVIEVPCNPGGGPTPPEVKKVVEPSVMKALVLLVLVLCILRYKQRSMKLKVGSGE
ncbi:MAG: hypothetical protein KME21_20705 [Desmonostoc vinosum HA7617-LM4]|jgi:hypothetical protein|nr:hypothetical protein [Desmonostoc vinosum HA7617-LM4]